MALIHTCMREHCDTALNGNMSAQVPRCTAYALRALHKIDSVDFLTVMVNEDRMMGVMFGIPLKHLWQCHLS